MNAFVRILLFVLIAGVGIAQQRGGEPVPPGLRNAQQLVREGKLDDALTAYRNQLKDSPDSQTVNMGVGVVLDLMGHGPEARKYFTKAIDVAATPQTKANAQRAMAMSYAFDSDCAKTVQAEQPVFDYYTSTGDAYQQGEIANEAARVCIDTGNLDAADKWYTIGRDSGLKEQRIKPERVALWNYRWEHAQGRLAARRGKKDEAQKHVAAAKALLDGNPEMAKGQAVFFPYLVGYVAFYSGDYKTAIDALQKANQNDPFIQCLMAQTYEKIGNREKATEFYERAFSTTAHNPPAAYAKPFARRRLGK